MAARRRCAFALSLLLVATGCGSAGSPPPGLDATQPTPRPVAEESSIRSIGPAPLEPRGQEAAVWTGKELLVWSGATPTGLLEDGAAWNAATGSWRRLPKAPIVPRTEMAVAWTGREMIVWGGVFGQARAPDGAAYDPSSDTWRRLAAAPIDGRGGGIAVWTDRELVILGGWEGERQDAAAYDPVADTWRDVAEPSFDESRIYAAAWTGHDVVVLGRTADGEGRAAAWDPATDSWRAISAPPVGGAERTWLFWDGERLHLHVPEGEKPSIATYEPVSDAWQLASAAPTGIQGSFWYEPAWTGRDVLSLTFEPPSVLAYDRSADAWRSWDLPVKECRWDPRVRWTGQELLVWGGGACGHGPDPSAAPSGHLGASAGWVDGFLYRPGPESTPVAKPVSAMTRPVTSGDIVVVDYLGDRIVVVGPDGSTVATIRDGRLPHPRSVAVGGDRAIYAANEEAVFRIDPDDGSVAEFVVDPDGGAHEVAIGPDGSLIVGILITEGPNHLSLRRYDAVTGQLIGEVATTREWEGALALDESGRVFTGCGHSCAGITRYEPGGGQTVLDARPPDSWCPRALALGRDGLLYVAETCAAKAIIQLDPNSGQELGVRSVTGIESPSGIAFGPDGTLYVSDLASGRLGALRWGSDETRLLAELSGEIGPLALVP